MIANPQLTVSTARIRPAGNNPRIRMLMPDPRAITAARVAISDNPIQWTNTPTSRKTPKTFIAHSLTLGVSSNVGVGASSSTLDASSIVADLKPFALYRFHEVEILLAIDLAEDDVVLLNLAGIRDRLDRAQLT